MSVNDSKMEDDMRTCYICRKKFPPLSGIARGIAIDTFDKDSEQELYSIEWFGLCEKCGKSFDVIWSDYELEEEL